MVTIHAEVGRFKKLWQQCAVVFKKTMPAIYKHREGKLNGPQYSR